MREVCLACRRPRRVCLCDEIEATTTLTHVVILQHPREHRMPIGTAHIAHRVLRGSVVRVGVTFDDDTIVQSLFHAGARAALLYPGPDARRAAPATDGGPTTVVLLDGTWSQARKLLHHNPRLLQLPRVSFASRAPSAYRIRRQPAEHCLSTIEALGEVLTALEPAPAGAAIAAALLRPFSAMVKRQERFAIEEHVERHRKPARIAKPSLVARLRDTMAALGPRLVLVQGEANAWPARERDRPPPELVSWQAWRPFENAGFETIVAPAHALAPSTPHHTGLAADVLAQGETRVNARDHWHAFTRPDDVVASWGRYYVDRAREEGWTLPGETIDVRARLSQALRARLGTAEDGAHRLGVDAHEPLGAGRGGRRLGALAALVAWIGSQS